MKGLILFSSTTGNTKKLANELHKRLSTSNDWEIRDIKENNLDTQDFDVILLGGWAEGGNFNKAMLKTIDNLKLEDKKVGLFMTLGAATNSEHRKETIANLQALRKNFNCIGIQTLQGKVSETLMEKLLKLPSNILPRSVKDSMLEGIKDYQEPTSDDYDRIAKAFSTQIF